MKVIFSKPKGQRIKKSRHRYRPLWIEPESCTLFFSNKTGEWGELDKIDKSEGCTSTYYAMEWSGSKYKNVWSLKSAIRKIKKWDVPRGTVFIVKTPWVGHEFKITKQ
jgi:hypothetical protein